MERGRAKGRISVRRHQMKLLEAGNATMAVWLGKQLLGQRDAITAEHVGSGGGPIQAAGQLRDVISSPDGDKWMHTLCWWTRSGPR